MAIKILKAAYHRNGVSGIPFHVAIFREGRGPKMLGIFFDEGDEESPTRRADGIHPEPHVAVFNLEMLAIDEIAFSTNSFRGDEFEHLRPEIEARVNRELDKLIGKKSKAKP